MRTKSLLIGLACFFVVGLVLSISGQSQRQEQGQRFEIIEIGKGGSPKWSPDGTRLAFVSSGWLCVANADGSGEIQNIVKLEPWTFDWMSDSSFVISERIPWSPPGKGRGHKCKIETVDMKGQVEVIAEDSIPAEPELYDQSYLGAPFVMNDGTVGYYEVHEHRDQETKIFKVIRQGKLTEQEALKHIEVFVRPYPWGDIWMRSVDGKTEWAVTEDDTSYSFPKLSPDGSNILAVLGSYTLDLVILDTCGTVITELDVGFKEVSPGIFAGGASSGVQWSPDSKKVVLTWFVESEQHPEEETSDLYIVNADGTGKLQLTDTPHEAEHNPVWSPNGTKIACHSDNTGKVFVINVD
jgi:Tol biopolymer transport system component